jgi:hypothetical protein
MRNSPSHGTTLWYLNKKVKTDMQKEETEELEEEIDEVV